ncbi:helix-turn-helix transcriptional regulator [Arenibacter sp. ARW7G5Y1]|uniref:helix-turn-helix domain-containing protein n=1 Tax=Arenibacter sp. ARW7G5Y1 TaxID=2135619 RepID=UPI000D76C72F|nr:helix-turn-helix transcriptional regulator [Arenibacter sp. ARW7G5Y1]PXX29132.1 hypothetical protein C7972_104276 [Arenibacter sp. ARW7G5Y1]
MKKKQKAESKDTVKDSRKMVDLLNALGITPNYLSKKVGVSHGAIFHIKNGINYLSDKMIEDIIKVYPNVNYKFLKHNELPVLLTDGEIQAQKEALNLPNNHNISVASITKFIGLPDQVEIAMTQLDRIEDKVNLIMNHLGLTYDNPDDF